MLLDTDFYMHEYNSTTLISDITVLSSLPPPPPHTHTHTHTYSGDDDNEEIYHIDIQCDGQGFGFGIRGGAEYNAPLCVLRIAEGGAADRDGRLKVGTRESGCYLGYWGNY